MGGFNLPMTVFIILVATVVAVPLLIWTDLPLWAVILIALVGSYAGLLVISLVIDWIERRPGMEIPFCEGDFPEGPDDATVPGGDEPWVNFFDRKKRPRDLTCPSCGSQDIAEILYGLQDWSRKIQKAVEEKKITLGGCMIYEGMPRWACNACQEKFGGMSIKE
ncbi:MAG: hypothetical protein ACYTG7_21070 [Planctomycetota bacterium]